MTVATTWDAVSHRSTVDIVAVGHYAQVQLEVRTTVGHAVLDAPSIYAMAELTWDELFRAIGIELFAPLDSDTLSNLLGHRLASKYRDAVSVYFPDGSVRPWTVVGVQRFALAVRRTAMQSILEVLERGGYLDRKAHQERTLWTLSDAGLDMITNRSSIPKLSESITSPMSH